MASISMSFCIESTCKRARIAPNKSEIGSHKYTLMYFDSHCVSEAWNPSYTATAKANGPRIASTIRKNVRMVSMIREAQSK